MLVIAAGHDQIVSTPAIDEFAARLRAGSHLIVPGARHELLMEQDRFRGQVLAAFDAFVPGTPIFGVTPFSSRSCSISSAAACTRLSPAATMRPPLIGEPFSQVVTMPPAPAMIGISAMMS